MKWPKSYCRDGERYRFDIESLQFNGLISRQRQRATSSTLGSYKRQDMNNRREINAPKTSYYQRDANKRRRTKRKNKTTRKGQCTQASMLSGKCHDKGRMGKRQKAEILSP